MHLSDFFSSLDSAAKRNGSASAAVEPPLPRPDAATREVRDAGSAAVVVPAVEAVPDPVPAPAASSNPLITSTAFFDLYPDILEGSLRRFRPKGFMISPAMIHGARRDWRGFAGDIRRSLPKAGVPQSTVDMIGDPVAIILGDWGDVRMLHDERGPRVLIRICTPEPLGVPLSFCQPNMPSTFNAVMNNIADACCRAHGLPKPIRDPKKPMFWQRRVFTMAELLKIPAGKAWY